MALPFPYRLIFLRHGQTDFNAENRLQGQLDVPLDGRGREQARAVGRRLRDAFGDEIARLEAKGAFWSSPLARARETMQLARVAMGLSPQPYLVDERLMELSFGDWEGLKWDQIGSKNARAVKVRNADKWRFTPPQGESYSALARRVGTWLDERDGDVLVVAHGGVARVFLVILAGVTREVAVNAAIRQGAALIFERGAAGWLG